MSIPTMASPAMLALQQKVNTLQKQGMPVAQIGQIIQSEAGSGTIPIAQLWQLMNYVKANSAPAQQPPSDSVAVQLADKVKALAQAKARPLGQVPQMGLPPTQLPASPSGQSGPSAGPPPGVAGLPTPGIGQPGAYAGGGIVSFDDGGDVDFGADVANPDDPNANPSRKFGTLAFTNQFNEWKDKLMHHPFDPTNLPFSPTNLAHSFNRPATVMNTLDPGNVLNMSTSFHLPHLAGGGIVSFDDGGGVLGDVGDIASGVGANMWQGVKDNFGNNLSDMTPNFGIMRGLHSLAQHYRDENAPQGLGPEKRWSPMRATPSLTFDPTKINFGPDQNVSASPSASGPGGLGPLPAYLAKPPEYPDMPHVMTPEEATAQAIKASQAMGLGSASKEAQAQSAAMQTKLNKDSKFYKGMALAEAGFNMATTASQGGATFLGAAGAGGQVLAKKLVEAKQYETGLQQHIDDLKVKAAEAADTNNAAVFRDVQENIRDSSREYNAAVRARAQLANEHEKDITSWYEAKMRANDMTRLYERGNYDPVLESFRNDYLKNPTPENYARIVKHIQSTNPANIAAQTRGTYAEELQKAKGLGGLGGMYSGFNMVPVNQ